MSQKNPKPKDVFDMAGDRRSRVVQNSCNENEVRWNQTKKLMQPQYQDEGK